MMLVRIDGQIYETKFFELAEKCTTLLNGHSIPVDAIFVKGNLTYLRVDQKSGRFDFFSKPIATIFGLPQDPLVNEVELQKALEEELGMEVNFVG